jgi:hypothetical protein
MKYQPLQNSFYIRNRESFVSEMEMNGVLILTSHDEYPRSGDTTFPFRQNSELLYLTGIDQEETFLVLAPWHPNPDYGDEFDVAISEDEKYIIFPFLKSWCFTTMSNYKRNVMVDVKVRFHSSHGYKSIQDCINYVEKNFKEVVEGMGENE